MTDIYPTQSAPPQVTPPLSRAEQRARERKLRRIESGVQSQIVDGARSRVPDVKTPPVPRFGARQHLQAARSKFALTNNRHLNRATRRDLAKAVRLT